MRKTAWLGLLSATVTGIWLFVAGCGSDEETGESSTSETADTQELFLGFGEHKCAKWTKRFKEKLGGNSSLIRLLGSNPKNGSNSQEIKYKCSRSSQGNRPYQASITNRGDTLDKAGSVSKSFLFFIKRSVNKTVGQQIQDLCQKSVGTAVFSSTRKVKNETCLIDNMIRAFDVHCDREIGDESYLNREHSIPISSAFPKIFEETCYDVIPLKK